jgi:restriction system protein
MGTRMPIPTYDKFIDPLLRSLAEHPDGVEISDAYERTSAALGLADDDLALLLPSGRQAVYKNRIGWAHDYLKRGGLSASPKRGFWQLTPVGLALARKYPQMPDSEMDRILRLGREARIAVRGTDDGRVTREPGRTH